MFPLKNIIFVAVMLLSGYSLADCNGDIHATTPSGDFTVHRNGTVTHNKTGLMWKVCSEGQAWSNGSCTGNVANYTWDKALQIPSTLNVSGGFAGYTDWRLPNIKELQSIVEQQCYNPSIKSTIFPSTASDLYWSSSPVALPSYYAWGVLFSNGYDYSYFRHYSSLARLVRGGQ
jgi:hypothetical protein